MVRESLGDRRVLVVVVGGWQDGWRGSAGRGGIQKELVILIYVFLVCGCSGYNKQKLAPLAHKSFRLLAIAEFRGWGFLDRDFPSKADEGFESADQNSEGVQLRRWATG